jgi:hypothetical protein
VDDRSTPISPHEHVRRDGADAAPDVRRSTGVEDTLVVPIPDPVEPSPTAPRGEGSAVVYCGDARQVSEGFALALRAMGIGAEFF